MRAEELLGYSRARQLRAQLELGTAPVADRIYRLLERFGVLVLATANSAANLSGAFFRTSDNTALVLINQDRTVGHQRFTAAHELSHFLYDKDMPSEIEQLNTVIGARDPKEIAANAFADEFLMPEGPELTQAHAKILQEGPNPEIAVHLQQHFGVSYRAMCRRLYKLGILSRNMWEELREFPELRRLTIELGYSTELLDKSTKPYVSPDYVSLAFSLYKKGGMSWGKLKSLLQDVGWDDRDLDSIEELNCDDPDQYGTIVRKPLLEGREADPV